MLARLARTRYRKCCKERFVCPGCGKVLFVGEVKYTWGYLKKYTAIYNFNYCGSDVCAEKILDVETFKRYWHLT
jgi:hypothetical protein